MVKGASCRTLRGNELVNERGTKWPDLALHDWRNALSDVPFAALPKRRRRDLHRALGLVLLCLEPNRPGRALKLVEKARRLADPSSDLAEALRKLTYLERMGEKVWKGPWPPRYPFHHYGHHFGAVVVALHERHPRLLKGLQREALAAMRGKTEFPMRPWPVWPLNTSGDSSRTDQILDSIWHV